MLRKINDNKERLIHIGLFLIAMISVLTTAGIIYTLISESIPFFQNVSLTEFLTGTRWAPLFQPQSFRVLPLLNGTFLVAGIAALIAILWVLAVLFTLVNMPLKEYVKQLNQS